MNRTKNRERVGPLKTEAGEIIDSGKEMSNLLNNYFLLVFTKEQSGHNISRGRSLPKRGEREAKGCNHYQAGSPERN